MDNFIDFYFLMAYIAIPTILALAICTGIIKLWFAWQDSRIWRRWWGT